MPATRPTLIAPSILSADFAKLGEELAAVEKAGADWIHIDVMDGRFVPNLTIGPPVIAALRPLTKQVLDVHLMIEEPERHLEAFAEAGADIITVHAEATRHLHRTLAKIRSLGKRAGVAINPHTNENVVSYVFDQLDLILVMTVNPGFGGQTYLEHLEHKVETLHWMIEASRRKIDLEVDGGVSAENAFGLTQSGANVLVAGSAIFGKKDYAKAIAAIRAAAAGEGPSLEELAAGPGHNDKVPALAPDEVAEERPEGETDEEPASE